MKAAQDGFTIQPWPRIRRLMADGGRMGLRKHTVHGLVEFDVTQARAAIHTRKRRASVSLSPPFPGLPGLGGRTRTDSFTPIETGAIR